MTKEQFETKCYDAYVLQWLASHGFSLHDVLDQISNNMTKIEFDHDSMSDTYYAAMEILEENGLGQGSLYVCLDEFLDNEFEDPDYMNILFKFMGDESQLRAFYIQNYSDDNEDDDDDDDENINWAVMKIKGNYTCKVPSDISIKKQKKMADEAFTEADFGELEDIDAELLYIEDIDGNYIYEED